MLSPNLPPLSRILCMEEDGEADDGGDANNASRTSAAPDAVEDGGFAGAWPDCRGAARFSRSKAFEDAREDGACTRPGGAGSAEATLADYATVITA